MALLLKDPTKNQCTSRWFWLLLTWTSTMLWTRIHLVNHFRTNITANWQRVFDKHVFPRPLAWTLDDGYPRVFPPDPTMRPFRAMASGEVNGLGVEVYLNTSEHQFECDDVNLGYTVSNRSNTLFVSTNFFAISLFRPWGSLIISVLERSIVKFYTTESLSHLHHLLWLSRFIEATFWRLPKCLCNMFMFIHFFLRF